VPLRTILMLRPEQPSPARHVEDASLLAVAGPIFVQSAWPASLSKLLLNKAVYSMNAPCFLPSGLPPFWQLDPVDAARAAALEGRRPEWTGANRHNEQVFSAGVGRWGPSGAARDESAPQAA
jgi:hypothetical protein